MVIVYEGGDLIRLAEEGLDVAMEQQRTTGNVLVRLGGQGAVWRAGSLFSGADCLVLKLRAVKAHDVPLRLGLVELPLPSGEASL